MSKFFTVFSSNILPLYSLSDSNIHSLSFTVSTLFIKLSNSMCLSLMTHPFISTSVIENNTSIIHNTTLSLSLSVVLLLSLILIFNTSGSIFTLLNIKFLGVSNINLPTGPLYMVATSFSLLIPSPHQIIYSNKIEIN
ncbi:hypothetical protein PAEPH01_1975 [Pancytospora epiphaga]|nr:hypothetical protein PAEPH01_1975 [Pancytospora epiphaga]